MPQLSDIGPDMTAERGRSLTLLYVYRQVCIMQNTNGTLLGMHWWTLHTSTAIQHFTSIEILWCIGLLWRDI